jgi:hypothetical protein
MWLLYPNRYCYRKHLEDTLRICASVQWVYLFIMIKEFDQHGVYVNSANKNYIKSWTSLAF